MSNMQKQIYHPNFGGIDYMKTTKIMGAILIAVLALALFAGAGAAVAYIAPVDGSVDIAETIVLKDGSGTVLNTIYAGRVTADVVGTRTGTYTALVGVNTYQIFYPQTVLGVYLAGTGTSVANGNVLTGQNLNFVLSSNVVGIPYATSQTITIAAPAFVAGNTLVLTATDATGAVVTQTYTAVAAAPVRRQFIASSVFATDAAALKTLIAADYPDYTVSVAGAVITMTPKSIRAIGAVVSPVVTTAVSTVRGTATLLGGAAVQYGYAYKFTTPIGGSTTTFGAYTAATAYVPATTLVNPTGAEAGTWKAIAEISGMSKYASSTYSKSNSISFTYGTASTESISISKDTIIRGNSILVTITGSPGDVVPVTIDALGFMPLAGQSGITTVAADYDATTGYLKSFRATLSSTGTCMLQFDSNTKPAVAAIEAEDTTYTFAATFPTTGVTKKAKVAVEKGTVTVATSQDSYFIGNDMTISGTNTESNVVYLFIKGSNVATTGIAGYSGTTPVAVESDNTWKVTFDTRTTLGPLDAGTYTIYAAASAGAAPTFAFDAHSVYESTSVALKQPFLTAAAASSTVAQGDKIEITGTAEAAIQVMYYIFGTNKFASATISVDDDGSYSKDIATDTFAAGQYFVVIQHPMYDGFFNIGPIAAATGFDITENTMFAYTVPAGSNIRFNTLDRQSANAAEALCVAMDSQNIDDIYVKLTFIVAQPTLTLNSVSDVTKGSALKVSGTTNLKAGTVITVDVLSTAFTAVDKSTVSSASFITLATKVVKGNDGVNTWEVTFDTTGLNVDTYTIRAVTADLSTSTVIKIIEKPTATATATATATTTATATATATATPNKSPGFGAFLALAGLGAVAVLVLRRD